MKDTDIIDHHQIIRDTVGYEVLNEFPLEDMPRIMEFLKVIYNHQRMNRLKERDQEEKDLLKSILEDRSNADGHDKDGNPKYRYDGYTYVLNPSCTEIIAVSFMKYED